MNFSPSLLAGVAALALSSELVEWLPGEASWRTLWPTLLTLPLPALAAAFAARRLARPDVDPANQGLARLAWRARLLAVPVAYALILCAGGLIELADRWAPTSQTARLAILLVPLLVLDFSTLAVERWVTAAEGASEPPFAGRLATTALVSIPILLFGAAVDLLALHRGLEVFFLSTFAGTTVGLLATLLVLPVLLPLLFRCVLPVQRKLPSHVDADVRTTAERLGFPPRGILLLLSGLRAVNAGLVGPLPWPRYLVLTDGITAYLDRIALRGVVAHEVGHARAGHPALLLLVFAGIPALLVQPISKLDLDHVDPFVLILVGALGTAVLYFVVRSLMHRFEFEADQHAAIALGGAMPCITALRRVGELFPGHRMRATFRHPSDDSRIRSLLAWETDAGFRSTFVRRGRSIRRWIAGAALVAVAASAWSHWQAWPLDRAVLAFYTGDFATAAERLEPLAEDDPIAADLLEQARIARDLVGSGDWNSLREELADRAWEEALRRLEHTDVGELATWFSLALSREVDDPVRVNAWLWSQALVARDAPRVQRVATHLASLDPPEALRRALRG